MTNVHWWNKSPCKRAFLRWIIFKEFTFGSCLTRNINACVHINNKLNKVNSFIHFMLWKPFWFNIIMWVQCTPKGTQIHLPFRKKSCYMKIMTTPILFTCLNKNNEWMLLVKLLVLQDKHYIVFYCITKMSSLLHTQIKQNFILFAKAFKITLSKKKILNLINEKLKLLHKNYRGHW